MCLSTTVTALGMIMAGTGDLECLRVMRELRSRVEGEVSCFAVAGVRCGGWEGGMAPLPVAFFAGKANEFD